jgi:serine/threonine protein phosphatase PrpC
MLEAKLADLAALDLTYQAAALKASPSFPCRVHLLEPPLLPSVQTHCLPLPSHPGSPCGLSFSFLKSVKDGFRCTDRNWISQAIKKKTQGGSTGLAILVNGDGPYVCSSVNECEFFGGVFLLTWLCGISSCWGSPGSRSCLLRHNAHLVVANLGDCRAVLCRDGRAVRLTEDHKPNRKGVWRRGWVE